MKTGDDTFDDIYVSKETGKVVGVMLDGRDYKLVPLNKCDIPMGQLADHINNSIYRKEEEK
ncbi:phage protein [Lacticaseibacillus casei A2-362]|nr:phage protein [Lacticaseibacillus casei A2-362]